MRIFIIVSLLVLTIGCGKERLDPVFNDYPLIGEWIAKDGRMYLNIQNVKNEGGSEKYFEYQENGRRMLRRTYQDMPVTYQIVYIDGVELRLAPMLGGGVIPFLRASK